MSTFKRPSSGRPVASRRSTTNDSKYSSSSAMSSSSKSSLSSRNSKRDDDFLLNCKAAYLVKYDDTSERIKSQNDLMQVLQQAGRNPSKKALDKFWKPKTDYLTYDDFVEICEQIPLTSRDELMKAFKKIDINGDGFITNDELLKVMTTRGEKMSRKEVQEIIDDVDENGDGKLDYKEFCKMMLSTQEESMKLAKMKMERKSKNSSLRSNAKSPRDSTAMKSREKPAVASMKNKLPEPKRLKDWSMCYSKGAFFFEEDGSIINHIYRLEVPKDTTAYITVEPVTMHSAASSARPIGAPPIDTFLFLTKDNKLMSFTQQRDYKGKYCIECQLKRGKYTLLPYTTGCRFKRRVTEPKVETKLVKKDREDRYVLTKPFKEALSTIFEMCDLDGNGLMSREEFNWFNIRTSGEEVADEEWEVVEENVELKNGELTQSGFIELNQMEAEDNQGDTEDLWVTLNNMGYNKGLDLDEAQSFSIEVYTESCDARLKVISLDYSPEIEQAVCEAVTMNGEVTRVRGMKDLTLYSYITDFYAWYIIENLSRSRVTMNLDCTGSKNCVSHQSDLHYSIEVDPKSNVVGHHLLPENEREKWSVKCIESVVK